MASKAPKNAGDNKKAASSKPTPAPKAAGATTAKKEAESEAADSAAQATGSGKPDQAAYNKEQDTLKAQIDAAQAKLVWVLIYACMPYVDSGDMQNIHFDWYL